MRAVVAPDKFKGSATAAQVASAVAAGLRRGRPDLEVIELPVADGGDGTVEAAVAAGFAPVTVTAEGPTGEPVATTFAVKAGTAVVELADVAGLRRLPGPAKAPLTASTYGVGQVIAAALDRGATKIVLGIGGSASTDGGAGMLQALGVGLADANDGPLRRGGAALLDLVAVDPSGLDRRLRSGGTELLVASDVDNPLLGTSGAARVFGPQKGASEADIVLLEGALSRWSSLTRSVLRRDMAATPGAGAAGGTGFAALAYIGADLVPGIDLILDLIGFDAALAGTSLVITGEGGLDRQSLRGKAPLGVARAASRRGVRTAVVAGQVQLTPEELDAGCFAAAYSLAGLEPDPARSMARVRELLEQVGYQIALAELSGLSETA